jgi:hypothetical protein
MAVNRTMGQTPRQFLRRKLVEGPNNFLPWFADFKFRIFFVELTSKFGKIRLLDDLGGQGSSPKDFICRLDLSNGLRLRPRKKKSRFGCFWTSQWAWKFYNGLNPLEPFSFGIFGKSFSTQILVEQGKVQLLLEKSWPFFRKKSQIVFFWNLE